jgi:hypothetical protein
VAIGIKRALAWRKRCGRSRVGPGGEEGQVRDGHGGGPGRRRGRRPGAQRQRGDGRLGRRRGVGEQHGEAIATVGAALAGAGAANKARGQRRHRRALRATTAGVVIGGSGGDHQVVQHGEGVVVVLLSNAAREAGGEERVAGHDPGCVVARGVEVGDGVGAAELDGGDVVRLGGLHLRTECSEVEVLVAGDAADARLPPPVLVVPRHPAVHGRAP